MRAVIQRVSQASVMLEQTERAAIGAGLLVLVGIEENDGGEDVEWLAGKIARLRIFNDANGVMNLSAQDIRGELLVVSQFTLHASTKKGNRPSYIRAARPETAVPIYDNFLRALERETALPVQSGTFGADMKVALVNDGPVTILIDTKTRE
jgi:D-tyrosyl-tRNA(Tyr) deacylase